MVKRRELYKQQKWDEYDALVKDEFMIDKQTLESCMNALYEEMGISESIIVDSVSRSGQTMENFVELAGQKKKAFKPKSSRKEAIENAIYVNNGQSELFLEAMKSGVSDSVG